MALLGQGLMRPKADMGSWALVRVGESCGWAGIGKAWADSFNIYDKESIKSAQSEVNREVSL